jgi:hypothetical protein
MFLAFVQSVQLHVNSRYLLRMNYGLMILR